MTTTTLKSLLEAIHEDVELSSAEEIQKACALINRVQEMSSGERDTLHAAFKNGPLFDGDVPSKSARDELLRDGMIAKVIVKGEDGFNACTYRGLQAFRLVQAGA